MVSLDNLDAVAIAHQIRTGKVSAEFIMRQTLAAASDTHHQLNCVTQFLSESAIREAKAIDIKIQAKETFSEEEYPLLGVPISVKDMLHVRGADTVAGRSEFVGKPVEFDSVIVSLLRRAGAIPFCKTNVPQFVWTAETNNPVFGTTINPINSKMTSGGSSGGEGALIAGGGSVLGVGSDIGGSLRVPAHFCGIYSFKPTSGRLPIDGHVNYFGGQESISVVVGPMANSVASLELFFRACLIQQPWKYDIYLNPIPFQTISLNPSSSLTVGYYTDDGNFPASPPCSRGVTLLKQKLQSIGFKLVPFQPPRVPHGLLTYMNIVNGDGMNSCLRQMSTKDQFNFQCRQYFMLLNLPNLIKSFLSWLLLILGQPNASHYLASFLTKSADEVWQLQEELRHYRREFQLSWENLGLDAVICPVSGLPAHPHHQNTQAIPSYGYTMLFNLLDYPAGVLPITHVDPILDPVTPPPDSPCLLLRRAHQLYQPHQMAHLPIGVQLVTPRNQDELLLKFMALCDTLIKSN